MSVKPTTDSIISGDILLGEYLGRKESVRCISVLLTFGFDSPSV